MKHMINILGLLLLIIIQSCDLKNQNDKGLTINKPEINLFDKYSNDSIRNMIFEIAYDNKSTVPSYIVFKAKDLNTGLIKEICCEAPFLSGALHRELNIEYDTKGTKYIDSIILVKRQGIFEFKNKEALKNISFYEYPNKEVIDKIAKKIDLDHYYREYGTNDSVKFIHFENDTGFVQETFAHIMFKCGIITSRDCVAGNNIWFGAPNITMPKIPNVN